MRAFLALDPPGALRDALDALGSGLRCGHPVDADDLHLTLVFLGDAPLDALDELNLLLEGMRPGPAPLELKGVGIFGSAAPRSVHALAVPHPALLHLQRKLATASRRAGLSLAHRRFVPHVTLARFGHRMPPEDQARLGRFLSAHGTFHWPAEAVDAVSLYRSTLAPGGPHYDLLARYRLS